MHFSLAHLARDWWWMMMMIARTKDNPWSQKATTSSICWRGRRGWRRRTEGVFSTYHPWSLWSKVWYVPWANVGIKVIHSLTWHCVGMFTMNEESRLYWFTPNPNQTGENTAEFKLAGLLLALAVYNSVILDLHLPLALYKKLMGVEVGLEDLKQLDPVSGFDRWMMYMKS